MYTPDAFRDDDPASIRETIRSVAFATLVTPTADGLLATPLPMFLDDAEGDSGTLYGHVARPNPHWTAQPTGESLAIFQGPHAYISPSWYPSKQETHKVVPTWNYIAVHAHGLVEFFEDADRLLDVVTRLTDIHEQGRTDPWAVSDAPERFINSQLRGIIGLRMPVTRLEGKRKLSQNRNAADRSGVVKGLSESQIGSDRELAKSILENCHQQ